jgi:hypothetical protein
MLLPGWGYLFFFAFGCYYSFPTFLQITIAIQGRRLTRSRKRIRVGVKFYIMRYIQQIHLNLLAMLLAIGAIYFIYSKIEQMVDENDQYSSNYRSK